VTAGVQLLANIAEHVAPAIGWSPVVAR